MVQKTLAVQVDVFPPASCRSLYVVLHILPETCPHFSQDGGAVIFLRGRVEPVDKASQTLTRHWSRIRLSREMSPDNDGDVESGRRRGNATDYYGRTTCRQDWSLTTFVDTVLAITLRIGSCFKHCELGSPEMLGRAEYLPFATPNSCAKPETVVRNTNMPSFSPDNIFCCKVHR